LVTSLGTLWAHRPVNANIVDDFYGLITWGGKNESGLPVGAGLYFYQLKTPAYVNIKKRIAGQIKYYIV
jgi:hypothetical protein